MAEMLGRADSFFSRAHRGRHRPHGFGCRASSQAPAAADADGRTPPRSFDLKDEPGYTGVLQLTARRSTGDGDDNPHVEIRGVMAFKSAWLEPTISTRRAWT